MVVGQVVGHFKGEGPICWSPRGPETLKHFLPPWNPNYSASYNLFHPEQTLQLFSISDDKQSNRKWLTLWKFLSKNLLLNGRTLNLKKIIDKLLKVNLKKSAYGDLDKLSVLKDLY